MRKIVTLFVQYGLVGILLVVKPEWAKIIGWAHVGLAGLVLLALVIVGLAALDDQKI